MSFRRLRPRVAEVLDASRPQDTVGRAVDVFLIALIALNVLAIIMESETGFQDRFKTALLVFEVFSVIVFTVEYALRVWSCVDSQPRFRDDPVKGRLRYMATPLALIDLIAILPFYLAFFIGVDLRFLRAVRLLRVFKLTRYSGAMQVLLTVLKEEASSLLAAFFILFILLIVASSGIYLLEHAVQPHAFGSIPSAMWWAMATLTTVGYGDVVPVTAGGRFFGGCITLVGMGMVALPAGILASAFSDQLHVRREAYSEKLQDVLADGKITDEETQELIRLQTELGLSAEETTRLYRIMLRRSPLLARCPFCGQLLDQEHDTR